MKLKIIGSGSSGNCYILESDTEALIIEAGLPFLEVKKALNFNVRKIVGVVASHCHGDHAKYVAEYEKAGIPVFKPYAGMKDMDLNGGVGFKIQAFPNQDKGGKWLHGNSDGTECPCYGFYIQHPDIGNLVYVTDTEYVRWRFSEVNHILVEANYSDELIESEAINREHVLRGHMSLQTALDFISTNDNQKLINVVLIHLSDKNGDSVNFQHKTKGILKYGANVYVAEKGLEVDLNLLPF